MRVLWYDDAAALMCICWKCVCMCMCAVPLASDRHECVSELHVLGGGFMCVCVRACGSEALQ